MGLRLAVSGTLGLVGLAIVWALVVVVGHVVRAAKKP